MANLDKRSFTSGGVFFLKNIDSIESADARSIFLYSRRILPPLSLLPRRFQFLRKSISLYLSLVSGELGTSKISQESIVRGPLFPPSFLSLLSFPSPATFSSCQESSRSSQWHLTFEKLRPKIFFLSLLFPFSHWPKARALLSSYSVVVKPGGAKDR